MGGVRAWQRWQLLSLSPAAVSVQLLGEPEGPEGQTPSVGALAWVRRPADWPDTTGKWEVRQTTFEEFKIMFCCCCCCFWVVFFVCLFFCCCFLNCFISVWWPFHLFLFVQIHRCSGCGPGCAFPPWPSCPSLFHRRRCHCLRGSPRLLHGAQVKFHHSVDEVSTLLLLKWNYQNKLLLPNEFMSINIVSFCNWVNIYRPHNI